ncbi:hydantoinase/oxoprolinase family protein [Planctomycetota bacterium]|nr:hydantoinase/oxoprolinase family protein [Planctomycetota bacterium]
MRIGVDTGGTFTDVVLLSDDDKIVCTHKLLSTPHDPSQAVLDGIYEILKKHADDKQYATSSIDVVHGSTVATNALLELRDLGNLKSALITTDGFTDVLAIARQTRPDLYALNPKRPTPPIPRSHCIGMNERLGAHGNVLTPLTENSINTTLKQIRTLNIESIAICLLHSYANPDHENLIADAIKKQLPDLHITVSSELLPEYREYERAATCAINAVVAPKMEQYIKRLENELGEEHLRVIGSHGGTLPGKVVRHHPVKTILSGPAGGVLGAIQSGQQESLNNLITFDMGGTSTDVSLIKNGHAHLSTDHKAAGLPVHLPMVDIHTVGAGGGSIAWVDHGGALRVGPQSAGATPGPACYGKQNPNQLLATVTDAHVVLGHIPSSTKLGEDLTLNIDLAKQAVQTIADQISFNVYEAAIGILRIAEVTMTNAISQVSLQLGHDPRDYTLVSFGGAGGFHACNLADHLGMTKVLIPTNPGLLSAVGMLSASAVYTFSHTLLQTIQVDSQQLYPNLKELSDLQNTIHQLEKQARDTLTRDNISPASQKLEHFIDLRYANQSYEITIPLDVDDPIAAFEHEHNRLYGYIAHSKPIELVAARTHASGNKFKVTHNIITQSIGKNKSQIDVYEDGSMTQFTHLQRNQLSPQQYIASRTIISEYSSTTIIPYNWHGQVTDTGQILLTKGVKS